MSESTPTVTDPITLDKPIQRGEQKITSVVLRKPKSGELRGTNLNSLVNMDVIALAIVLPRISIPTLTSADVDNLDPADLMKLGIEVSIFFLPASAKDSLPA